MFIIKTMRNLRKHFENNFVIYLILFFCLLFGIIFGSIIIKRINYNFSRYVFQISNPYFSSIDKNVYTLGNIFKRSVLNNLSLILILICLSFINFGVILIPIIIFLKGLSLGLSVGILVDNYGFTGFLAALFGIYPQNVFILPGLIGIAAIAFCLSNGISRSMSKINLNNMGDILSIALIFVLIIFLGTSVEGFISPHILKLVKDGFSLV